MDIEKELFEVLEDYMGELRKIKIETKIINRISSKNIKKAKDANEEEVKEFENYIEKDTDEKTYDSRKVKAKTYNLRNKDVYIGKIINNCMEGIANYRFENGVEYIGEFVNNQKCGIGTVKYPSGNMYQGNFEDDKIHGVGEMAYSNEERYIGHWVKGKKEGRGVYIWEDGYMYIGEFKNNKMEGMGMCCDEYKNILYIGQWRNNIANGKGTYIWEDGKKYIGDFMNGKKHGEGAFYLNNEIIYEGQWKFDKPSIFDKTIEEIFIKS